MIFFHKLLNDLLSVELELGFKNHFNNKKYKACNNHLNKYLNDFKGN